MRRVRVVAGLFRRGDAVLVQQRPAGKARGGLWEFPGGKVEPGESDAAALVRECREELGVPVRVEGPALTTLTHAYDDLEVDLVLLPAVIEGDAAPQPHDAQALEWVARAALGGLSFCEADVPLLPKLASGEL